ncbi:MAG TPA: putative zinc-binding metallopeptidase [Thermoanaerobaculia bacterium]|nr:putative zinc-binding metallopeptidase [Thermoanaerobaculia bacterium]
MQQFERNDTNRTAAPSVGFEKAPRDVQHLLPVPIKELGLKLEGSPIEGYVQQLFKELDSKGLKHFRPAFYLTSEWGCPSEEPVIGVPFYLADRRLGAIESAINDLENEREIMMYMRHEAGHAFNYAYELYNTEEWHELFGPFRRPYRDRYRFVPFSKNYVRHIAGWYAQKHPDEDFAETFAVWLAPGSKWRQKYKDWPAMKKLRYVDRICRELGEVHPKRPLGETDFTVEDMEETIAEFYKDHARDESDLIGTLALEADLDDIFLHPEQVAEERSAKAGPAVMLHRKDIVDKVSYWTGVRRPLVKTLVESVAAKAEEMGLVVDRNREAEHIVELTTYITTLAMNFFVGRRRPRRKMA